MEIIVSCDESVAALLELDPKTIMTQQEWGLTTWPHERIASITLTTQQSGLDLGSAVLEFAVSPSAHPYRFVFTPVSDKPFIMMERYLFLLGGVTHRRTGNMIIAELKCDTAKRSTLIIREQDLIGPPEPA